MSEASAYRAARESVAFFPDLDRAVVQLTGSRAVQAINGLVTNDVDRVLDGSGCYAFMLDPRGRPIADLRVLPAPSSIGAPPGSGQTLWLDVAGEAAAPVMAHLARYVPPMFAASESVDVRRVTVLGPAADACLRTLLTGTRPPAWADPGAVSSPDAPSPPESALHPHALDPADLEPLRACGLSSDTLLVRREEIEGSGFDLYLPGARHSALVAALETVVVALGGVRAPAGVWEVLRVEQGIPTFGSEISGDRLAQETGQEERAISFEKGCFTGQEVVARIHYRGHVNRLLRGLRALARPEALIAGAELTRDGRTVGAVHTAVQSPRFGRIGLATVRREVEPGDRLSFVAEPGAEIEVVELPFT